MDSLKRVLAAEGQLVLLSPPRTRTTDPIDPISLLNLGHGHVVVQRMGFSTGRFGQGHKTMGDLYIPIAPGEEAVLLDAGRYNLWLDNLRPGERDDYLITFRESEPKRNPNMAVFQFVAEALTPNGVQSVEITVLVNLEEEPLRVYPR
ncbi:MAG TPA: hypothetical protein VFS50_10250 [Meiothermus sp.]|nr:hypothetical protein [Meiothermus sp.]